MYSRSHLYWLSILKIEERGQSLKHMYTDIKIGVDGIAIWTWTGRNIDKDEMQHRRRRIATWTWTEDKIEVNQTQHGRGRKATWTCTYSNMDTDGMQNRSGLNATWTWTESNMDMDV